MAYRLLNILLVLLLISLFGCVKASNTDNILDEPTNAKDTESNITYPEENSELPINLQHEINKALYGKIDIPYDDIDGGLIYSLRQVIENPKHPVKRPEESFTQEAWESNALQYLIENGAYYQTPIPYPARVRFGNNNNIIRGYILIDLLLTHNFGTKPALLFFVAEKFDDDVWKFSHFGRLQILEILEHNYGLPYPEESPINKADYVIIID